MQNYLYEAKDEFYNPTQEYKNDLKDFYEENVLNVQSIKEDIIKLHFTKKYDSQHRYYLNFKKDGYSSKNYDCFRNIALPRVTKLNFVKVKEISSGKLYIYIKPIFFVDEKIKSDKEIVENLLAGNVAKVQTIRKQQSKYRHELLDKIPSCVITKVTEDRILEACHIKPFNKCDDDEKYDVNNGLVMTPTYHSLFDLGFISFKDNGELLVSPFLSNMNKQRLNLSDNKQYRIPTNCAKYLEYHRNNVFNQIPDLSF